MIFLTWYLYSLDENMKKLTEARDGKELSVVVIIKQINSPTLPWAKDPSKRRLRAMILHQSSHALAKPPPPHPRGLAMERVFFMIFKNFISIIVCTYGKFIFLEIY